MDTVKLGTRRGLAFIEAAAALPGVEITALCGRDGERLRFMGDVAHLLVDLNVPHHWRTWIQPTFYCTHSIAPLLRITGLRPVAVTGVTGQMRHYKARFPDSDLDASGIQHWGADLFLLQAFVSSVRSGVPPDIDVYMGVPATLCGNFAWRSILAGGVWQEIPDLRHIAERDKWRNDHYSCRPGTAAEFLWPNNAVTGRLDTLSEERRAALRAAQKKNPYQTSVFRD